MTEVETTKPPRILQAEFEFSAPKLKDLRLQNLPEVAFLGRSNVGKSSLLNALCERSGLARTSKTPGRTQALNFFRIEYEFHNPGDPDPYRAECFFVDLPGFGYAKVSKSLKFGWKELIGEYLLRRERLEIVLLLVDSRRVPGAEEQWLADSGKRGNFFVVMTKSDKLPRAELAVAKKNIAKLLKLDEERVIPVSTQPGNRESVKALRERILSVFLGRTK